MAREWPYRYEIVPIDRFFVDVEYQRPLTTFVDEIANDFKPELLGTLTTSERKNRTKSNLALIDGQTRWQGAMRAGETELPSVVFHGLTRAQEAQIFSDIQTKRRNLASHLRFRAQLIAERETGGPATDIARIAEKSGFVVGQTDKEGTLRAVAALERVYKAGPDVLEDTMRTLREAWPQEEDGVIASGEMVRGVGRFIEENEPDVETLIRKLRRTSVAQLRFRANALREGTGGGASPGYMADAIMAEYTKRG